MTEGSKKDSSKSWERGDPKEESKAIKQEIQALKEEFKFFDSENWNENCSPYIPDPSLTTTLEKESPPREDWNQDTAPCTSDVEQGKETSQIGSCEEVSLHSDTLSDYASDVDNSRTFVAKFYSPSELDTLSDPATQEWHAPEVIKSYPWYELVKQIWKNGKSHIRSHTRGEFSL